MGPESEKDDTYLGHFPFSVPRKRNKHIEGIFHGPHAPRNCPLPSDCKLQYEKKTACIGAVSDCKLQYGKIRSTGDVKSTEEASALDTVDPSHQRPLAEAAPSEATKDRSESWTWRDVRTALTFPLSPHSLSLKTLTAIPDSLGRH